MSLAVCSRSHGHSTRSTSTMRLSETSSWPSRASSKAGPSGTVTSGRARGRRGAGARPRRARSARASSGPCAPGERDRHVGLARARDKVGERRRRRRVDLDEAALAGVGGLGDERAQLALEPGRDEDGAAAGERPQRSCGRQLGGGADVYEAKAHPCRVTRERAGRSGPSLTLPVTRSRSAPARSRPAREPPSACRGRSRRRRRFRRPSWPVLEPLLPRRRLLLEEQHLPDAAPWPLRRSASWPAVTSVTSITCQPNCDLTGTEISLTSSFQAAFSNSGTIRPLETAPRAPPVSLEPGSSEYSLASFFQLASLGSASSSARTSSASALVLTRMWRVSRVSGWSNCALFWSSKYFLAASRR